MPLRGEWAVIVAVLAVVTMTVGNLAALGQDNIKRMLAYSSIAHTGYIMVGLVVFATATSPDGRGLRRAGRALLRRRLHLHEPGRLRGRGGAAAAAGRHQPDRHLLRARATGRPCWRSTMTVFLLSLTGIPPLAGFFAKAIVVLGALEVGGSMSWLAVIMMLNAAAAAFYYLRVVVYMYMRRPADEAPPVSVGGLTRASASWPRLTLTILIGLVPPVTQARPGVDRGRGGSAGAVVRRVEGGGGSPPRHRFARVRQRGGTAASRPRKRAASTAEASTTSADGMTAALSSGRDTTATASPRS